MGEGGGSCGVGVVGEWAGGSTGGSVGGGSSSGSCPTPGCFGSGIGGFGDCDAASQRGHIDGAICDERKQENRRWHWMGCLTTAVLIESIRLPPEPQRTRAIAGTKHALPSGEMPGPRAGN